jgi:glyoxylase-like metal-dependent hydrolase (beta-lactamase superfamily II)
MPFKDWHEMKTPWFTNLTAAGINPAEIDFVMCTHLHVDHVGWNTRLQDGQWVPTFPNAKYIFSKHEYEFWRAERDHEAADTFGSVNHQTFDDSVVPIMHLAELIEGETELIAELLTIKPAPGHTPGSIAIEVANSGELGIFTGDICHHPIQVAEPDWNSAYCELPDQARSTRREILERCHNHNALMLPAHFAGSFAGHVRYKRDAFSFDFL